ncbi:DUF1998 domain-containing protein [Actinomadura sp. NEAU-AAG5]|uniref:DUF1998 domain-containing protein n=2 Tax=Actinomadura litoris TaxID=2678616 RepID=A0A7K1L2B7_9ACTN|nr:DUF1998 domain-containing protein [Actinomadura litoris]
MITTYGVGSMVAIGDQSYIISGLDTWNVDGSEAIYEPRLERWLGVQGFQPPPAANPPSGDGVRVRLFPEFYSCANCHDLKQFRKFGSPRGKSQCGACEKPLTPSRFVIACENGHLDDFPYFDWVHKRTDAAGSSQTSRHDLSLHSTGRTASLRSVVIRCSCQKEASLEGAFGRRALQNLGIKCQGNRPWLGRGAEQAGCEATPRTLQRGSSAAWFPINRSALSIPPWSETLQKRIHPHYKMLKTLLEQQVGDDVAMEVIKGSGILPGSNFTPQEVLEAVRRRWRLEESEQPDPHGHEMFESASRLRREEYEKLTYGTATVDRGDDFECTKPPEDPDSPLPIGVGRTMQVQRLREVRALESFTRVEAPDPATVEHRKAAVARAATGWLPAIEVSGEGVFLTLDMQRLHDWETREEVLLRANRIRDNHTAALRRRAMATAGSDEIKKIESPVSARYLLLHTLGHALINEWSLEAGYPAASLRERLYVSGEMAGLLIYTATSDSAGSLGGVVAQGEYKRIRESLKSAMNRVSWCSQDPPCMETDTGGVDGLNLAACYACVLLPETSCEVNNIFLDRAMLIGASEDDSMGYFTSGA